MIASVLLVVFVLRLIAVLTMIYFISSLCSLICAHWFFHALKGITYLIYQLIKSSLVHMLSFVKIFFLLKINFPTSHLDTHHHVLSLPLPNKSNGCENSIILQFLQLRICLPPPRPYPNHNVKLTHHLTCATM